VVGDGADRMKNQALGALRRVGSKEESNNTVGQKNFHHKPDFCATILRAVALEIHLKLGCRTGSFAKVCP
jgi:hypothetical protein